MYKIYLSHPDWVQQAGSEIMKIEALVKTMSIKKFGHDCLKDLSVDELMKVKLYIESERGEITHCGYLKPKNFKNDNYKQH
jgi:alpha-galactosidase